MSKPLTDREMAALHRSLHELSPYASVNPNHVVSLIEEVKAWRDRQWTRDTLPQIGDPILLRNGKPGRITTVSIGSEEEDAAD